MDSLIKYILIYEPFLEQWAIHHTKCDLHVLLPHFEIDIFLFFSKCFQYFTVSLCEKVKKFTKKIK